MGAGCASAEASTPSWPRPLFPASHLKRSSSHRHGGRSSTSAGPDDGSSQQAIAATLATQLAGHLLASAASPHKGHAAVTLSEHDLTVLATANNPHPDRFHNVQARVRNGLVLVSADTSVGPL